MGKLILLLLLPVVGLAQRGNHLLIKWDSVGSKYYILRGASDTVGVVSVTQDGKVTSWKMPWTQIIGKPSFFSGNYNDLTNKPTIPTVNTPTVSNPVRAFNSAFQPSSIRNSEVQYSISISASMSISGGQSGTVYLETSPNNSIWTLQAQISTANSGALAVGLNLTNTETKTIRAFVPAGYWVRLRTAGTGTITYITSQEVLQ